MNARKITTLFATAPEAPGRPAGHPARARLPARRRRLSDGRPGRGCYSRVVADPEGRAAAGGARAARLALPGADRRPARRRAGLLAGRRRRRWAAACAITNPTFTGTTRGEDRFRFTAALVVPDAAPPQRARDHRRSPGRSTCTTGRSVDGRRPTRAISTSRPSGSTSAGTVRDRDLRRLPDRRRQGDARPAGRRPGRRRPGAEHRVRSGEITSGSLHVAPAAASGEARRFSFGNGVRLIYDPPDRGMRNAVMRARLAGGDGGGGAARARRWRRGDRRCRSAG